MYAGIDLGATNLRAAIAEREGAPVAVERRETPSGPTGEDVAEGVVDTLRAACREAGIAPGSLDAVGIGSIGPLDLDAGAVTRGVNLPSEVGAIPLREPVAELAGAPVVLRNDAVAAVHGEREGRGIDDLVYLTLSTGIGAGAAVDGRVLSGRSGNAGEVGHFVVDPEGRMTCGCGGEGHWEAYCAGANLPAYARHLHERESIETDLALDALDAATPFDRSADPLAAAVIERIAGWNEIGVANLVHAFAPSVVAIGGAVALRNPERVIEPIRERVPDRLVTDAPAIRPARHGEDAVLRGAIALARDGGR